MSLKVSIVTPIYEVEKYIKRCVRSLFEQTLDNKEYIFVEDCYIDNSIQILQDILKEYQEMKCHTDNYLRVYLFNSSPSCTNLWLKINVIT